jgi:hypothetical protein
LKPWAVLFVCWLWPAVALALEPLPPNPYLAQAQELYQALKYPQALERLELAQQVPGQSSEQQAEVFAWVARCQIALGRGGAARSSFQRVLQLRPDYDLGKGLSPKITEVFESVKSETVPADFFQVQEKLGPSNLRLEWVDPWHRAVSLRWRVRRGTGEAWISRDQPLADGVHRADLPVSPAENEIVFWYVEFLNREGAVVHSVGTAISPRTQIPSAARPAAAQQSPTPPSRTIPRVLAYSAAGVAVATLSTGAYFGLQSNRLGQSARAEPWSDTSRGLQGQAESSARVANACFIGGTVLTLASGAFLLWLETR